MERKEAQDKGFSTYNTGRSCKHGHLPIRYSINGACIECHRQYQSNSQKRGKAAIASWRSRYALLTMKVHPDIYLSVFAHIQAMNALMGVPESLNTPDYVASPIDGGLMRREDYDRLLRERDGDADAHANRL